MFHPGFDHQPRLHTTKTLNDRDANTAFCLVLNLVSVLERLIESDADARTLGRQLTQMLSAADLGLMPESDPFDLYPEIVSVGHEGRVLIYNYLLAYTEEDEYYELMERECAPH